MNGVEGVCGHFFDAWGHEGFPVAFFVLVSVGERGFLAPGDGGEAEVEVGEAGGLGFGGGFFAGVFKVEFGDCFVAGLDAGSRVSSCAGWG